MDWYTSGYRPVSPQVPMFEAFLWTPRAHFKKERCDASQSIREILFTTLTLFKLVTDDERLFTIGEVGSQIGAPYSKIGLIRESKSVVFALNDILARLIVPFSPKMLSWLWF